MPQVCAASAFVTIVEAVMAVLTPPGPIPISSENAAVGMAKRAPIVTKLDRLARSTRDLLNTLAEIGKAGATFKSLGDPWTYTRMGALDADCARWVGGVREALDPGKDD